MNPTRSSLAPQRSVTIGGHGRARVSELFIVTPRLPPHTRIHSLGVAGDPFCGVCMPGWPQRCRECSTGFTHADPDLGRVRASDTDEAPLLVRCQDCGATHRT